MRLSWRANDPRFPGYQTGFCRHALARGSSDTGIRSGGSHSVVLHLLCDVCFPEALRRRQV